MGIKLNLKFTLKISKLLYLANDIFYLYVFFYKKDFYSFK